MNFELGNYKKNVEENLTILENIIPYLEERIGAKVDTPFIIEFYVDAQFIHLETYYTSEDNDGTQYVLYEYRINIYNENIHQMSDTLNIYFDKNKNLTRIIINQIVIIENELLQIFKNYETLNFYLGDNDE